MTVSSPNLRKVLGIFTDTADTDTCCCYRRLSWLVNRKCPSRRTFFPSGNEPKTTYETKMSSTLFPTGNKKKSLLKTIFLYFLRQLKKSHVATSELLLFYITCIRSILEYGSPVFHRALPSYLSEDLERLGRAMKIIHPELSYAKVLVRAVQTFNTV